MKKESKEINNLLESLRYFKSEREDYRKKYVFLSSIYLIFIIIGGILAIINLANSFNTFELGNSYKINKTECHNETDYSIKDCLCLQRYTCKEIFNYSGECYNNLPCKKYDESSCIYLKKEVCKDKEVDEIDINLANNIGYVSDHPHFLQGLDDKKVLIYIDGDLHFIIKKQDITKQWLETNCLCKSSTDENGNYNNPKHVSNCFQYKYGDYTVVKK